MTNHTIIDSRIDIEVDLINNSIDAIAADPSISDEDFRSILSSIVKRCHATIDAIDGTTVARTVDPWTTSASADAQAHDQEIDLGDGWHALVYPFPNGVNWGWELWDQWMHSDEDGEYDPRESGIMSSESMAKTAALIAGAAHGRYPR